MKHLILLILFNLSLSSVYAQVITKLSGGASSFFYDVNELNTIVSEAMDNDTIILPGGPINLNGSLVVNKKLVLIGAGIQTVGTPVTGITTLIGTNVGGFQEMVVVESTGAGSKFTGMNFQAPFRFAGFGNDAPTFSAAFERCMFSSGFALSAFASPVVPPSASNVTVKQCIFLGEISASTNTAPQNLLIENSILAGGLNFGGSNIATAQVTQCLLLNMSTTNGANQGVQFTNSIFTRNGSSYNLNSASSYANSLFVLSGGDQLIWSGAFNGGSNVGFQGTSTNVFLDLASFTTYSENSDYHLVTGSPGLNMGTNGEVGIYGGPTGSQWKEGAIPFNPHWESLQPSLGISNGGVINVSFSGAAQQD